MNFGGFFYNFPWFFAISAKICEIYAKNQIFREEELIFCEKFNKILGFSRFRGAFRVFLARTHDYWNLRAEFPENAGLRGFRGCVFLVKVRKIANSQ